MLFKTLNTQKDEKKADGWIFVHILVVPSNMVKKGSIVLAVQITNSTGCANYFRGKYIIYCYLNN